MPFYEYRLLDIQPAAWEKAQDSINKLCQEGYRYRDKIYESDSQVILIFERETTPKTADVWTAAQATMKTGASMGRPRKQEQDAPKYPPEQDE